MKTLLSNHLLFRWFRHERSPFKRVNWEKRGS